MFLLLLPDITITYLGAFQILSVEEDNLRQP